MCWDIEALFRTIENAGWEFILHQPSEDQLLLQAANLEVLR